MADLPVEVKKTAPTETTAPDVWGSFRSELDWLFDRFGFPSLRRMFEIEPTWRPTTSFTFSAPAIDLSEDDNAYKISAELPGLDAKDVELSVSGNTLVERAYGSFQRAFELPASIDRDKIAADFSKGVLTISLPKTPDAQQQQKKIEVKSA